ncbi:uncharacterized protein [Rhodnius prolixus]|uniref:Uncharacterized protein n=1 Tax=Rhodnius prolixus TaxID=13249 RepID=T1HVN5_RHOPR
MSQRKSKVKKKTCTSVAINTEENYLKTQPNIKFQELSLEMVVKIFTYVNLSKLVNLNTECRLFRHAIALNTRDKLLSQKRRIDTEVMVMWQNLQKNKYNINRIYEAMIQMTFLQSDVHQFYVLVWRYVKNIHIWSYLARFMQPIMDEIDREMVVISKLKDNRLFYDGCRMVHPQLQEFINDFHDTIEIRFNEDEIEKNRFLIKFIDIVTLSPAANYQITYEQTNRMVTKIEMILQLRNIPYDCNLLNDFNEYFDFGQKELHLMKYLQRGIRYGNMTYVNDLLLTYLPNVLCYYMDGKGYIYCCIDGWFRCRTIRHTHNQHIDLSIQTIDQNVKRYVFQQNIDYQTYSCGLFGKIVTHCTPELQPITFNELHKKSELIDQNGGNTNSAHNPSKKTKKTRTKLYNQFDVKILEDIGSLGKKKVRETGWSYSSSLDEYTKSVLGHNFK